MNPVTRGVRNAFRNMIRTVSIIIILGISVGLALSMLVARQAVQDKINSVKSTIGNTITVSPAGARGFEGGGNPLTTDNMNTIAKTANVTGVQQTLNDRLTSSDSNLQSAVDAGAIGNRAQANSGVGFSTQTGGDGGFRAQLDNGSGTVTRTFTPPVLITGISDASSASTYGGNTVTFTSGSAFDASKDANVAVIGKSIAEKNSLSVGSTFTAYGATVKVVGIYDAGNTFANNGVFVPISTLQRLSSQPNTVSSAIVTVNSIDNLDSTVKAIENSLGSSADVVSNQDTAKTAVQPLESVKTISTYSVIGALIAGAIIILLTMMMIVRERRREIGVMKAIGSSNAKTMLQFVSEAITLTFLGLIVGLVISVFASQPITKVLVTNSSSNTATVQVQGAPGGGGGRAFRVAGGGGIISRNVRNVQTSIGPSILAYGVLVAFVIAILGSALPAYAISKVRPAEVMRAD